MYSVYIATILPLCRFEPCTLASYLSTIDDVRSNLTKYVSVSPIGTGLLANSPIYIHVDQFINNNYVLVI